MGRRQRGLLDHVFDTLVQMPWWAGVTAAFLFWVFGAAMFGESSDSSMNSALAPLFKLVFNGLALLSLAAAVVSAIRGASRRKLLDRQKGIDSVRLLSWREFEQLVGEAYRRRGYDIEERGGSGSDGGVDLVLRGQGERVLVQCKQWRARRVGVDKVRELFGVVAAAGADRGILVTSGRFTQAAQTFATGKALDLVDGSSLAQLVPDVQRQSPATVDVKLDMDSPALTTCPVCGSDMVLRTARRGPNTGSQFYGCTQFPKCRGTRKSS